MRLSALLRVAVVGAVLIPALPGSPATAASPALDEAIVWSHPTGLTTDAEVFAMRPDGTAKRRVTENGQNDFFPAWSPDGRALAYESSSATDVDVWILDVRGERNLTNDPGHANRYPSWSPDGSQLVYSRQSPFTGTGPLFTIRRDGSAPTRITSASGVNENPSWSPDGQLIAFVSDRSGNHDLWVVRPDGTGLQQLTDTPDIQEGNPDWSPDGTRLAYDVCRSATFPCPGSAPNYEIVTANADGSGLRFLTHVAGIDANPAWSPDGSRLVFRSDRTGFTHVWTMTATGGDLTQLTTRNFTGGVDPDWRAAVTP